MEKFSTPPENGLAAFFANHHQYCDGLWSSFEEASSASPAEARASFEQYEKETLRHLDWEETVLFPAFEQATGMTQGPTAVMRSEHERMRALLQAMADAIRNDDIETALDQGDTLLLFTQQHNQKEEAMLYPMAENALQGQWPSLAQRLC